MVLISLRELTSWLDITVFELWTHFLTLLISSILLCLKLHNILNISYMTTALPIFMGLVLSLYFVFIIYLRSCVDYKDYRTPTWKFIANVFRLLCLASLLHFIVEKISGQLESTEVEKKNSYGMVFLPLWILLAVWFCQLCRTTNAR